MNQPTQYIDFSEQPPITIGNVVQTDVLDGSNVLEFGTQALDYISEHSTKQFLISFENVRYMSSAALTELLRINQAIRENKGTVRLCGMNQDIQNIFKITNLEKLFVIHENENLQAAASRFKRSLELAKEESAWSNSEADG
jgi:anti-sigma B factor antagonist